MYVQRRQEDYVDRRMLQLQLHGKKSRGRPNRKFMDEIKEKMKIEGVIAGQKKTI